MMRIPPATDNVMIKIWKFTEFHKKRDTICTKCTKIISTDAISTYITFMPNTCGYGKIDEACSSFLVVKFGIWTREKTTDNPDFACL